MKRLLNLAIVSIGLIAVSTVAHSEKVSVREPICLSETVQSFNVEKFTVVDFQLTDPVMELQNLVVEYPSFLVAKHNTDFVFHALVTKLFKPDLLWKNPLKHDDYPPNRLAKNSEKNSITTIHNRRFRIQI